MVQALIKGEVDFVEDINALQVSRSEGRDGITAHKGDSPGFDEIAFNIGAIDTETGEPIGDGTRRCRTRLPPRARLRHRPRRDHRDGLPGCRVPGDTIIPSAYATPLGAARGPGVHVRPRRAGQLLDEAGYTWATTGRTMPTAARRHAPAVRPTEEPLVHESMEFFAEWLAESASTPRSAIESSKLTDVILEGEYDTFEWGWYVEPDPDSIFGYSRASSSEGGTTPGGATRSTTPGRGAECYSTTRSGSRPSSGCRRSSSGRRRTS